MSGGKASGNQAVQYTGNEAGEGSVVVSRAMCLPAAKQARGKGKTVGLLRQGLKFSLKSGRKKEKQPHLLTFEVLFSKNKRRSSRVTMGRRGGSRERKGFMVKVWWAGQQQQEDELVEELPDYYI